MKPLRILLPVMLVATASFVAGQDRSPSSADAAAAFAAELSRLSPLHENVPLRTYAIRDLDHDGRYEVLETVSAFESAPGFLNVEIATAFEWVHVYRCKDGKFTEDTRSFRWFLSERKAHYEFWRRVLDAPSVLSPDSRSLVEANRTDFRRILDMYLKRIEDP